jgi:hypothetical protein
MTVIRRRHNARFASLPNAIWEDPRLTVEAKGVLGYLLSRPHNWNVRPQQVAQVLDLGKDRLQRIFRELIAAGYVTREQSRDESTKSFGTIEYVVRDEPEPVASLPQPENPAPAEPQPEKPQPGTTAAYKVREVLNTESNKDDADDARAIKPSGSMISPEAFSLGDDLMRLQHLEKDDPRCIGTAYGVQAWLTKGWDADVIRHAVEAVMSRCTKAPRSIKYFEGAIAEAHAERNRALPIANPSTDIKAKNHGTSQKQSGVVAAARRLAEQFESRPCDRLAGNSDPLLRLPAR